MKSVIVTALVFFAAGLGVFFFLGSSQYETMDLDVEEANTSSSKSTNQRRPIFDDALNSEIKTTEKKQNVTGNISELSTTPEKESLIADEQSPEQVELDGWYEGFRERLFQNISTAYESQPVEVAKLLKHINHLDSLQGTSNFPTFNPLLKPKYYQDFHTDDEWAQQVESELRSFILSQSLDDNFNLIDIACKQLVCRLYYEGVSAQELFKLAHAISSYVESLYFIDYFGVRDSENRTGSTSFGMADRRMFQYQQISFESHHRR